MPPYMLPCEQPVRHINGGNEDQQTPHLMDDVEDSHGYRSNRSDPCHDGCADLLAALLLAKRLVETGS